MLNITRYEQNIALRENAVPVGRLHMVSFTAEGSCFCSVVC